MASAVTQTQTKTKPEEKKKSDEMVELQNENAVLRRQLEDALHILKQTEVLIQQTNPKFHVCDSVKTYDQCAYEHYIEQNPDAYTKGWFVVWKGGQHVACVERSHLPKLLSLLKPPYFCREHGSLQQVQIR